MEVFKVSIYYKAEYGLGIVNLAAACPTGEPHTWWCHNKQLQELSQQVAFSLIGGVIFTEDVISWYVPRRVTPFMDGQFRIVEMHMGINGLRLDRSQMAARGYMLSSTDFHIVVEVPVGSPDGYYKVWKSSPTFNMLYVRKVLQ